MLELSLYSAAQTPYKTCSTKEFRKLYKKVSKVITLLGKAQHKIVSIPTYLDCLFWTCALTPNWLVCQLCTIMPKQAQLQKQVKEVYNASSHADKPFPLRHYSIFNVSRYPEACAGTNAHIDPQDSDQVFSFIGLAGLFEGNKLVVLPQRWVMPSRPNVGIWILDAKLARLNLPVTKGVRFPIILATNQAILARALKPVGVALGGNNKEDKLNKPESKLAASKLQKSTIAQRAVNNNSLTDYSNNNLPAQREQLGQLINQGQPAQPVAPCRPIEGTPGPELGRRHF